MTAEEKFGKIVTAKDVANAIRDLVLSSYIHISPEELSKLREFTIGEIIDKEDRNDYVKESEALK